MGFWVGFSVAQKTAMCYFGVKVEGLVSLFVGVFCFVVRYFRVDFDLVFGCVTLSDTLLWRNGRMVGCVICLGVFLVRVLGRLFCAAEESDALFEHGASPKFTWFWRGFRLK